MPAQKPQSFAVNRSCKCRFHNRKLILTRRMLLALSSTTVGLKGSEISFKAHVIGHVIRHMISHYCSTVTNFGVVRVAWADSVFSKFVCRPVEYTCRVLSTSAQRSRSVTVLTSSSAVIQRPHDASCLSVVSFNKSSSTISPGSTEG